MSLQCIALLLYVVDCINAFHIHHPLVNVHHKMSTVGRVTQSSQPPSMCRGVGVVKYEPDEPDEPDKPSIYLDLDSGVRISRIMVASTDSFDVMQKLCHAKSRTDIMQIALLRYRRKCALLEYQQIPVGSGDVYTGWSYEHRPGSVMRSNPDTPSSTLWVVDETLFPEFEVQVGSWLLASVQVKDDKHLSTLFSRTISRYTDAQPISLVRPGFAHIPLVHTPEGPQWVATFIELGNFDELGAPAKAKTPKPGPLV
jgi:hypothetical protein